MPVPELVPVPVRVPGPDYVVVEIEHVAYVAVAADVAAAAGEHVVAVHKTVTGLAGQPELDIQDARIAAVDEIELADQPCLGEILLHLDHWIPFAYAAVGQKGACLVELYLILLLPPPLLLLQRDTEDSGQPLVASLVEWRIPVPYQVDYEKSKNSVLALWLV